SPFRAFWVPPDTFCVRESERTEMRCYLPRWRIMMSDFSGGRRKLILSFVRVSVSFARFQKLADAFLGRRTHSTFLRPDGVLVNQQLGDFSVRLACLVYLFCFFGERVYPRPALGYRRYVPEGLFSLFFAVITPLSRTLLEQPEILRLCRLIRLPPITP